MTHQPAHNQVAHNQVAHNQVAHNQISASQATPNRPRPRRRSVKASSDSRQITREFPARRGAPGLEDLIRGCPHALHHWEGVALRHLKR